ncbi:MAG: hypothetical protein WBM36_05615 [Lysobacterales bacterium]
MERRKFMRSMATLAVAVVAIPLAGLVEARVGRPATPGSVAGVRRRTRRRTRRRVYVGMSLATLPYGCTTRVRGGITYHYCGGIWYQPRYQGTTVVYVVNQVDPGADINVEFEE